MAEKVIVVVGGYRGDDGADVALPVVKRQAEIGKLKIHDAGIVRRTSRGEVEIKDTGDWGFGKGALAGGAAGAMAAVLAGPIGWGLLAGAAVVGGVAGKVRDSGISDKAMQALGKGMEKRTSALVLMVAPGDEATVMQMLVDSGANVTSEGLDADSINKMAHAYNAEAKPPEAPPAEPPKTE